MGTSKANNGPKGISKPLQDWNTTPVGNEDSKDKDNEGHDVQETQDTKEPVEVGKWADAKRSFTAFTKNPTKSNYKKFYSNYVKASGGSSKLSRSAIGGRKGAVVLLNFLDGVANKGLTETLEKYNIGDISSLQTEGAVNELAKLFSDIDGTDEGSAASAAAIETINKLYNDYSQNPETIENLRNDQISEYLEFYISTYIFERISIEVTKALEDRRLNVQQVNTAESHLKSYIEAEVNLNFKNVNFSRLNIKDQDKIVSQIFKDAYSII